MSGLKETLLIYALCHQFLQQVIEGDELYTKINKNVPPDESQGWALVLMDRASRFLWELECGRKDCKLFRKAMRTLLRVIEKTGDLSLLTDGERRYGNLLFEICHELLRTGKPGRPKKTLKKGVKVRVKNKGSQTHKKGPKRPKYQTPQSEHPETTQTLYNDQIHANHDEAFGSFSRFLQFMLYPSSINFYSIAYRPLAIVNTLADFLICFFRNLLYPDSLPE